MTGRPPHYTIAVPFCMLLVSLNVTPAPTEAGLLDKVKGATPSLASVPLIKAIGDYTKGVVEEGTALVKEGMSGNVDAATYNRRADDFLDRKANLGVTAFLQDAADNLKLKVSNPLAGLKDKLGDTRFGRAAAAVKGKIWATTEDNGGTGVAKPDEQYGAIDPRIALDVQEEETEWYQNETGIMDETSLSVAYLNEEIDSLDDAQERSHQDVWYQDEDGWVDETAVARRADEVQERDPWTNIDNGADEWEESAGPDCTNAWVDIDAGCGDEYQGDEGRSEETDVAGLYDETQEGTYQEAMDRLLGNEPASYSDEYSVSAEGYEGALAQLEAEAAERERQAKLAAEAAERERLARLAAEAAERERLARLKAEVVERERLARLAAEEAERERQARLAARAAERQRRAESKRSDDNVVGSIFGAILGGAVRGLAESRGIESGTSGYGIGRRRGTSGGGSNSCPGESSLRARLEQVTAKLNSPSAGMCMSAREAKQVFREAVSFYQNCPAADPGGQMLQTSREMIAWANQTERQTCNSKGSWAAQERLRRELEQRELERRQAQNSEVLPHFESSTSRKNSSSSRSTGSDPCERINRDPSSRIIC